MPSTALDAALAYADRGWFVFPVQTAPNKRPLCEGGFRSATTDHTTIVEWWTRWPAAQVGIDCGQSGIVCVDLDQKDAVNGADSWNVLEMDHGGANCGLCMKTPRGNGQQLFFADPDQSCRRRIGIRLGVDVLGDGGYTIVPSPASPGRSWRYGDPFDLDDLSDVPEWIVELAGESRGPKANTPTTTPLPLSRITPLPNEQVADIRAALSWIPNDERDVWLRVCFALKSTGAGEQAYALWTEWSRATPTGAMHPKFNERDQRYTWEHASEFFADGHEVNLVSLFWLANEYGYQGPIPDDIEPVQIEIVDATKDETSEVEVKPNTPAPEHSIQLMDWQDVADMPMVEWQVDGLIPRASMAMLAGDTEAGKSFGAIDLAMRIVHGLPFCGRRVVPGNVLYLAGEGQSGLAARFRAWRYNHQHFGLDDEGRYCVVSSEIPVLSKKTMHILGKLVDAVAKAKDAAPAMIVIDTLSQGLDDDENEAKVVAPVLRALVALAKRWGATIVIVHHLVKLQTKGKHSNGRPTRDSIRGSGSLTRNIDTVLGLVVTDEGTGARELQVWKQKDGEKPAPIQLHLVQAPTGWLRPDTHDETSCILVPAVDLPELPAQAAASPEEGADGPVNAKAMERLSQAVDSVIATLEAMGAVQGEGNRGAASANGIVEAVGKKRSLTLAAIKEAARLGRIVNVGTDRAASWLVVPEGSRGGELVPEVVPLPGSDS
jgi:KaiC/GvpD/RAD55 family RecA-like ATPase